MRIYCRPGATPFEKLEAHVAFHLRCRPEVCRQVAGLVAWTVGRPPEDAALRKAFPPEGIEDPAEALGAARAVLLLCGVAAERESRLTGDPREDFARLLEGEYGAQQLTSPKAYSVPSLLEAYCYMGAGFARGVDRVFRVVSGRPLIEHLRHALTLLEQAG